MVDNNRDIEIQQFARKNVISLPKQASIAESIRLMEKNKIRHLPILHDSEVVGVVNSNSLIKYISNNIEDLDLDENVENVISSNFQIVKPDYPLFSGVEAISQDPEKSIIIEETKTLTGIYTQIDVLRSDFLWLNSSDHPVSSDDHIGNEIKYDGTNYSDKTIHDTLLLMNALDQNYVLLTEGTNIVQGIVDFLSLISHIYFVTYRQGKRIASVLEQPMYTIFPGSGIWYKEPVLLSKIRRDMHINDLHFALVMDKTMIAKRVISLDDITEYLVQNSDYFDVKI